MERRFGHGYAFGFAYTLGKSEDNASEQLTTQGSNAFPQTSRDFTNWYGPSDYDVRHRFSANFVWLLPLGNNVVARAELERELEKALTQVMTPDNPVGGWFLGIAAFLFLAIMMMTALFVVGVVTMAARR